MKELKARRAYFSEDDYERGTHKICAKVSDCGYDRKNDWWSYAFEDEVYLKSEVDKVIADLEESHKKEIEQLLMKIAGLEKLVETADKFVKQKGGFTVKDITFDGVKLEGMKND